MTTIGQRRWWWAAMVPAFVVMLGASSSMYVHAYRPTTFHHTVRSAAGKPASFAFDYDVDGHKFQRTGTVTLVSAGAASMAEYEQTYQQLKGVKPQPLPAKTQVYRATLAWEADPESPLDQCAVKVEAGDFSRGASMLTTKDPGKIDRYATLNACDPQGKAGPVGHQVLPDLDAHILPGSSKRPPTWENTYYFLTEAGFTPEALTISWRAPHAVVIQLPD